MTATLLELRPPATTLRYEGDIPELRGRRGWVERVRRARGELRYDITLTGACGHSRVRLVQVSPDAIVID